MPTLTPARLRWALLATALAIGAAPSSASAAVLSMGDGTLFYQGGGERNRLSLREVAGALIVSDTTGLSNRFLNFTTTGPCAQVDGQTMRCPVPRRFEARMAEGDDTVGPINTHLPVVIRGEGGNDTYQAGNPSFLTNVDFRGGRGSQDTVTYAGSGGSGGGRGVRIVNDGQPDDGRIGLDTDNIGRDVERLFGSALRDEITANGPLDFADTGEFAHTEVIALRGDDVIRVGADGGLGVTIRNGAIADGADTILNGPAVSTVDYSSRTRPVNVTHNFGGADDGEAGERDEIRGFHELVIGGQAGDTLRANTALLTPNTFAGNGGGDLMEGGPGDDVLTGGPGGDTLVGFGGADRLNARDGERDTVDCGLGTDAFEVDSFDNFGNCENGTVGVLRLTPKTLRAQAGETARLSLAWRHPRGWRQLRRIELRVYGGDARVGAVAIRPRAKRIETQGALLRLAGKASRLSHRGKTVSARLALRLDRSLAGERLRLEVAAVDRRGVEQLERRAGSIRVARSGAIRVPGAVAAR